MGGSFGFPIFDGTFCRTQTWLSATNGPLDLLDVLISHLKTGLENKEFCLWLISNSELLTAEEATSALGSAVSLAEILKKCDPRLPILFSSGYTDDAILANGALETNVNFVQKPYSLDEVGRNVRELLDARRRGGDI